MAKYQIIYWRNIPVQVRVRNGRKRLTLPLTDRFQKAVHRAAYRGKAITGDAYIEEWQPTGWQNREGGPQTVLEQVAAELEAAYSDERLDELARNKGYDPSVVE